jgi:hypothetical protein
MSPLLVTALETLQTPTVWLMLIPVAAEAVRLPAPE